MKYFIFGTLYKILAKPIFFLFDPELVHDTITRIGSALGKFKLLRFITHKLFVFKNEVLVQNIFGIEFSNPVGLSEGFDKDAHLVNILGGVGFGFTQVGSVTKHPYEGNPKPRLVRLKRSKSILVNYGLKSDGVQVVLDRLSKADPSIPVSISIAKTNSKENASDIEAIADYQYTYQLFNEANTGNFYTINISCPNTYGGEPFTTPERLEPLLKSLTSARSRKPIFIKMPINLEWEKFQSLLEVIVKYGCEGVIIGNLNKDRGSVEIADPLSDSVKGNMSGVPTRELSNNLISNTYEYYGDKLCIIGVGGIFSADDAYEKIKRGATLVQLITGMIFNGPQLIGEINKDLVALLQKDGYSHISQSIGAYHR